MSPAEYTRTVLKSVGSQELTERDVAFATDDIAFSDASFASPELLYGQDAWRAMLAQDSEGVRSAARYEFDWNFGLTPKARAEAVWANTLRDNGFDMLTAMNNATYEASKVRDASHVDAVRRRRSGFGGAM